jgi:hypothetical protein
MEILLWLMTLKDISNPEVLQEMEILEAKAMSMDMQVEVEVIWVLE